MEMTIAIIIAEEGVSKKHGTVTQTMWGDRV